MWNEISFFAPWHYYIKVYVKDWDSTSSLCYPEHWSAASPGSSFPLLVDADVLGVGEILSAEAGEWFQRPPQHQWASSGETQDGEGRGWLVGSMNFQNKSTWVAQINWLLSYFKTSHIFRYQVSLSRSQLVVLALCCWSLPALAHPLSLWPCFCKQLLTYIIWEGSSSDIWFSVCWWW